MSKARYVNELALLATYGTPEQQHSARNALEKIVQDHEQGVEPVEDIGVQDNATQEQLAAMGVPYHGSVLLMEIDAARIDQEKHDTLQEIKRKQNDPTYSARIRTCENRMLYLRRNLKQACREQEPLQPWFYHALLTLAFVRRNARVLKPTRATRGLPVVPASSADTEDTTCYDDYDLIEELRDCSCCVQNVWHQLMLFLERMRMREFELQPLDEQERKWCHEHDPELRQIFLYLRGELRATNPEEYRAIWELFQTGNLDLAEVRRQWRGVRPHVLSRKRAALLLDMVVKGHLEKGGLQSLLFKELVGLTRAVRAAHRGLVLVQSPEPEDMPSGVTDKEALAKYLPLFNASDDSSKLTEVQREHHDRVHQALQELWTTCVRERIGGNQTRRWSL